MNCRSWAIAGVAVVACAFPSRWAAAQIEAPPTYGRDVSPLLREKCGACHAPGGLAPFSLGTHAEARSRAGKIARITLDGLMPPWLPARGTYAHDRRLTPAEIALLRRWVEAGAPEGESASPWPARSQEWQLGKPDLVLTVPRFHQVPGNGELHTAHFVFPLNSKETRYLRAVEVMPGNRRVMLEASVWFDRSGRARELAGDAGWYQRFGGLGFFPAGMMPGYTPGRGAMELPADAAMTLTPDTDLILQARYRPSGHPEVDVTRVALYFAPAPPARHPSQVYLGREDFRIAPGAMEEVIRDQVTLAAPLEVRSVRPKLLRFGRAVRAWAEPPSAKPVPLLEIHDWELAWQETYTFGKPLVLPKGTTIICEWTVSNPTQQEARPGETPADEAPNLWVGGLVNTWAEHVTLTGANLLHYTELMEKARRSRK